MEVEEGSLLDFFHLLLVAQCSALLKLGVSSIRLGFWARVQVVAKPHKPPSILGPLCASILTRRHVIQIRLQGDTGAPFDVRKPTQGVVNVDNKGAKSSKLVPNGLLLWPLVG